MNPRAVYAQVYYKHVRCEPS